MRSSRSVERVAKTFPYGRCARKISRYGFLKRNSKQPDNRINNEKPVKSVDVFVLDTHGFRIVQGLEIVYYKLFGWNTILFRNPQNQRPEFTCVTRPSLDNTNV